MEKAQERDLRLVPPQQQRGRTERKSNARTLALMMEYAHGTVSSNVYAIVATHAVPGEDSGKLQFTLSAVAIKGK